MTHQICNLEIHSSNPNKKHARHENDNGNDLNVNGFLGFKVLQIRACINEQSTATFDNDRNVVREEKYIIFFILVMGNCLWSPGPDRSDYDHRLSKNKCCQCPKANKINTGPRNNNHRR